MVKPPIAPNEAERLATLRNYAVLDTPAEKYFDDVVALAAYICGTPIAQISLVDENRQWIKATLGLDAAEAPRDISFCAHAIQQREIFVVPDATQDERFADNPLVTGQLGIRFYAGSPLIAPDGHALGTLCVIDRLPRQLTAEQEQALSILGRHVVAQLELRLQARKETRAHDALLGILEDERLAKTTMRDSERKFRALFDAANDGTYMMLNGIFIDSNVRGLAIFGMTREQLIGQTLFSLSPTMQPDGQNSAESATKLLQDALAGEPQFFGWVIRRLDGTPVYVDVGLNRLELGDEVFVQAIVRDVTQRKQAEEAALQKDMLIRMAGRLTRTGGWYMEMSNRKVFWSDDVCDIMECAHGYAPDLVDALALHPDDSRDAVTEAIEACARDGTSFDIETEIKTTRGRRIWGRVCGEAVREADGTIGRIWGAFQDITERKVAGAELAKNQTLLRVASRIGRLGAWQVELPSVTVKWSDETASIHDEPPGFSPPVVDAIKYYTPRYREIIQQAFEACARDATPFDLEAQINTAKGRRIWVRSIGEAVRDAEGKVVEIRGAFQDIDNLKQTEERVAEQAALLDRASEAIFVKDVEGRIIYWNKGAEQTYGWIASEAMGRLSTELLYKDLTEFKNAQAELVVKGEWRGELSQYTKDGRELRVEVRWTLVRDEKDQPKSILAINTDITEKKQLAAQFLRAQRMESIGTLAGGVAHDLNNILAPIMMSIDILKLTANDPQAQSVLETIAISAKRGSDIVRQVLSFARGLEGERVEIQPGHLLKDLEHIIKDTFPKDIHLRFSAPSDIWTILGDPTQVHQILLNLSVNARDAMPHGGNLTISVENCVLDEHYSAMHIEAKAGRYVKIDVADSGMGIPPALLDKIFEPFFTTKEVNKGTGLGLSTVMAIIKSHGGIINVYSELGHGTTFKVYLPAVETLPRTGLAKSGKVALPQGKGETVMVIDDEASILTITSQTLQAFGYRVLTATDGAEAIALYALHRQEIAVVLTDMMMPVMDGAATIRALKKLNPAIRIIAASGLNANGTVTKVSDSGVKHFLTKPYTAGTLLTTLQIILNES